MKQFRDRVAVITGGASGIGRAVADRLGAEGMKIVLADVEADALAKAESELRGQGVDVSARRTDVSQASQVEALADHAYEHFGAVHVLFNNAGVALTGPIWENSQEELEWLVNVNLWGVLHGIRSFVPRLLEQGGEAAIVNTASMAGLSTAPLLGIYNVTKFGVVAISETVHKELAMLGSDVRVSVLCPGLIRTRIMESERNRPGSEAGDPPRTQDSPSGQLMQTAMLAAVQTGFEPSLVADQVFEAIRDERFYILPAQPEVLAGLDQRLDDLRERRNPSAPVGLPIPTPDEAGS